jgi:hypothetical protein
MDKKAKMENRPQLLGHQTLKSAKAAEGVLRNELGPASKELSVGDANGGSQNIVSVSNQVFIIGRQTGCCSSKFNLFKN